MLHPAVLRERRRIARELHDSVGHGLLLISMQMRGLARMGTQESVTANAVERIAQEILDEVRSIVGSLRSTPVSASVEDVPLSAQVATLIAQVGKGDEPIELALSGTERRLPPAIQKAALHVAQEGLTNALKHDGRHAIRISLDFGERLTVSVVNGSGSLRDFVRPSTGYGLLGLRELVISEGGEFTCGPLTEGFLIQATLPDTARPNGTSTGSPPPTYADDL
ncbi:histidine kinase [Nonomuraea sp. NPDC049695]|uniref:sensor histidine kinase n=1 Tax=Nonomuraea sp. NPDC049695 TaxID=3154734 RepID=UPI00343AA638